MTTEDERPRRRGAPPERGWALGATGLSRAVWGGLAIVLLALAVLLFLVDYHGYGALVTVLAAAAAVNLW